MTYNPFNSSLDTSDKRFLWGFIGFLALGPALIVGLVALHNRYQIPNSCYISQTSVTINAVVEDYATCKADASGLIQNLDLAEHDQKLQLVTKQLEPNTQFSRHTQQTIEAIFSDTRVAIIEQSPQMIVMAKDLLGLSLILWFMLVTFFLSLFFESP